jgi:N-acetylglucosamine-6-phosphate deacetylase
LYVLKLFSNARLVLKDSLINRGFLLEDGGKIARIGDMAAVPAAQFETIDCKGHYLAPGFIDLHTHGAGGYDFFDATPRDIIGGARAHMAHGTTSLMPTTLTSDDKSLYAMIDGYHEALRTAENMPHFLGLHLEGPYFSVQQKGAQPESYMRNPEPSHYFGILEYAKGAVKRWSLAPELPGALDMIKALSKQDILLSAAHTDATLEEMKIALEHGITLLTHFYSGMSSIVRKGGFRVLGAVESGYILEDLAVEIIADGIHLPPDLLKMILKLKNRDMISLCTDSMRGAGMPEGRYFMGPKTGGYEVIVEDGVAKLPDRSAFAGSVATANRLVNVMVYQGGLPIWEAVKMITHTPARLIGQDHIIGSLEANKRADLILFDEDINIRSVYISGKKTV